MILTGKKPEIIGNFPVGVAREGERIGNGDGLPADFDFSAPLTHDLILERGIGPATFGRTTIGFIQDNEDIFNSIDIAAARFKGARYLGSGLFSNLDSIGVPIPSATLKGFLSEEQRTNDIQNSRDFGGAGWSGFFGVVSTQDQIGIDGQVNKAWTLTDNNALQKGTVLQSNAIIPLNNDIHVSSVFIKKDNNETRFPGLIWVLDPASRQEITVQVNTKTGATNILSSIGNVSVNVIDVGLFWFIYLTVQNNSLNAVFILAIEPANSTTWGVPEVTAMGSIIVDQAQLEISKSFSSSPIETIAAVTRTADRLQYIVLGNVENNNISCFIKWTPAQDDLGIVFIWGSYVDIDNYTALLHDGTDLIIRKRIASVNNDATITLDYNNNTIYKIGWRFSGLDGIDIWLDGIKGINNVNIANLQLGINFEIGSDGNDANHDFSYHKENEIWNRTLSNSEMAALTS